MTFVSFLAQISNASWRDSDLHPDYDRRTPELCESRGFKCETHHVTTLDDYIIGVHRIINPYKPLKQPVMVLHGHIGSGRDFLVNSPGGHVREPLLPVGNNLGFELAKNGFDVWLANSRGNIYSRNHTTLNPDTGKYSNVILIRIVNYHINHDSQTMSFGSFHSMP